ncbi:MAG TPA: SRPBCC family protein [Stellaceae bacterium]|nr:SRPBCC family protein [Stellaceae bacterium]
MEFENSFEVPLPPAEAWPVLMDIERIAPCMPGAELTEVVDKETYKGKVQVRLGPVALSFAGTAKFEEIDAAGHTAKVRARGNDAKGRGAANALVAFRLEPSPAGSRVVVRTDLTLTGAVAQYGRGVGMIRDLAGQLMGQFATCLKAQLAARPAQPAPVAAEPGTAAPAPPPPLPPAAKPISGVSLMLRVLWNALVRLVTGRTS